MTLTIVFTVVALSLAVLTATGARRRGAGIGLSVVEGVLFPIAWTAWYVKDELPVRRG